MMYQVSLSQFVENGAAVLAERARVARLSAHKFELLNREKATSGRRPFDLAA